MHAKKSLSLILARKSNTAPISIRTFFLVVSISGMFIAAFAIQRQRYWRMMKASSYIDEVFSEAGIRYSGVADLDRLLELLKRTEVDWLSVDCKEFSTTHFQRIVALSNLRVLQVNPGWDLPADFDLSSQKIEALRGLRRLEHISLGSAVFLQFADAINATFFIDGLAAQFFSFNGNYLSVNSSHTAIQSL